MDTDTIAKAERKQRLSDNLTLLKDIATVRPDLFKDRKFIAGFSVANQNDVFYQIAIMRGYKGAELVKELETLIERL